MEESALFGNTTITDGESRLSVQLFYVLALTCRGKSLQAVGRVPEAFGFEAWKQLCKEFEPRLTSRFQGMLQAISSPTTTDDPVLSVGEQGQSQRGTVGRQRGREHQAGSSTEVPVRRGACSPPEPPVRTPDDVRIGSQGSHQLPACRTDMDGDWHCGPEGLITARQGQGWQERQEQGQR